MRRIVITGATGMLGHRLVIELARDAEVHALVRSAELDGSLTSGPLAGASIHYGLDLSLAGTMEALLRDIKPEVVVNAAGLIKQKLTDDADESILSRVNRDLPKRLGILGQELGFKLINISTDCVFSGARGQYRESDLPDCEDEYGLTKLQGESCGAGSLVLRTSIIGRELRGAYGLLEWFLSNKGMPVRGFANAFFSGLTTNELSRVVRIIIERESDISGLFHVAGTRISKADLLELANELFDVGAEIERVVEPFIDRSLDATKFNETIGYAPPSWKEMLTELAEQSGTYDKWRSQNF